MSRTREYKWNWVFLGGRSAPQKLMHRDRSSRTKVFLGKCVLKICNKFTGQHPCRSVFSIKLQSNFIEITIWHGCSAVNLLHIFRTPFLMNIFGGCFCFSATCSLKVGFQHADFSASV